VFIASGANIVPGLPLSSGGRILAAIFEVEAKDGSASVLRDLPARAGLQPELNPEAAP
jgi:hypothetical protein